MLDQLPLRITLQEKTTFANFYPGENEAVLKNNFTRCRFLNFFGPCGPRPLGTLYPFSYLIA